jgi:hypothetical protein
MKSKTHKRIWIAAAILGAFLIGKHAHAEEAMSPRVAELFKSCMEEHRHSWAELPTVEMRVEGFGLIAKMCKNYAEKL